MRAVRAGGARARECATSAEAAGRKREQQRQQLVPAVNWAPGAARGGQVAKEKPRKTSRSSKEEENQRNSNQARSRAHARTDLVQPSKEFGRAIRRLSKVIYFFSPLLHCHQARCVCVCARAFAGEEEDKEAQNNGEGKWGAQLWHPWSLFSEVMMWSLWAGSLRHSFLPTWSKILPQCNQKKRDNIL